MAQHPVRARLPARGAFVAPAQRLSLATRRAVVRAQAADPSVKAGAWHPSGASGASPLQFDGTSNTPRPGTEGRRATIELLEAVAPPPPPLTVYHCHWLLLQALVP